MDAASSPLAPVAPHTVVVADDDRATRELVARWVTSAGFTVLQACDGRGALECINERAPDVAAVVLDIMMPEVDGFGVLGALQSDPKTASIPVVLLSAHATGEPDVVRGLEAGASSHLSKPFSGLVLIATLRQLSKKRSLAIQAEWQLSRAEAAATRDVLTGLWNRRQFEMMCLAELGYATRHRSPSALVVLDLDHFKTVNDVFGHQAGDHVLLHFAQIARKTLRAEDHVFRIGGEEFALLLRGTDVDGAESVVERLRRRLASEHVVLGADETRYHVRFSAGIAAMDGSESVSDVLVRADGALYAAKRDGRNRSARA